MGLAISGACVLILLLIGVGAYIRRKHRIVEDEMEEAMEQM